LTATKLSITVEKETFVYVIKRLLEAGAKPDKKGSMGATALMFAAASGQAGAVEALLAAGADPRIWDNENKTARDHAVENNHPEIVPLLE